MTLEACQSYRRIIDAVVCGGIDDAGVSMQRKPEVRESGAGNGGLDV